MEGKSITFEHNGIFYLIEIESMIHNRIFDNGMSLYEVNPNSFFGRNFKLIQKKLISKVESSSYSTRLSGSETAYGRLVRQLKHTHSKLSRDFYKTLADKLEE